MARIASHEEDDAILGGSYHLSAQQIASVFTKKYRMSIKKVNDQSCFLREVLTHPLPGNAVVLDTF